MTISPETAQFFHADKWTDGYDDANSCFLQFCKHAYKLFLKFMSAYKLFLKFMSRFLFHRHLTTIYTTLPYNLLIIIMNKYLNLDLQHIWKFSSLRAPPFFTGFHRVSILLTADKVSCSTDT